MRAAALALLLAAAGGVFAADGDNELRLGKATLRAGNAGRAMEFFKQAADKGNAEAMHFTGLMYEEGKGVAADPAAAAEWFRRAADKGHPPSMNHLGNLLRNEKPAEALQWHRKAAEAGEPHAMQNVANAYYEGVGAEKNLPQAAEWYRKAAERGNDFAMLRYGYMLSHGEGIPQDVAKAFAMYTQGARFWFEKSALSGNSLAMSFLARIYDGAYGLPRNDALATYWWVEAYKKGSPTAQKVLQERGLVAKRDPVAQAYVDRIDRNGPDRSSVEQFTLEVAQYCKYGGDRCHELSVAALKFQRSSNAAAESANMARLWNAYGAKDDDAKWRERSDCMKKKTESIQKHTYGQQDWYYAGTCY